jgi:hypothetical protein
MLSTTAVPDPVPADVSMTHFVASMVDVDASKSSQRMQGAAVPPPVPTLPPVAFPPPLPPVAPPPPLFALPPVPVVPVPPVLLPPVLVLLPPVLVAPPLAVVVAPPDPVAAPPVPDAAWPPVAAVVPPEPVVVVPGSLVQAVTAAMDVKINKDSNRELGRGVWVMAMNG